MRGDACTRARMRACAKEMIAEGRRKLRPGNEILVKASARAAGSAKETGHAAKPGAVELSAVNPFRIRETTAFPA